MQSNLNLVPTLGDATTAIFLLNGFSKFGLSERVGYHFNLTASNVTEEYAGYSSARETDGSQEVLASFSAQAACGVSGLLECAPVTPWHRLSKKQKRALKTQLRSFNMASEKIRQAENIQCYQPNRLPLRLNPSTRIFFAYEVTRIAFCVDASPSLTSTFGINGTGSGGSFLNGHCCPLDRLPEMARTFFHALVEPVSAPSLTGAGIWKPILAVSVIAVFPLGHKTETSLLVRDFRVDSVEAAETLADRIDEWVYTDVEVGISERLNRQHSSATWSVPLRSSSLKDILEAGDCALDVLCSDARPLMVLATDCRSVTCDGIVDVFLDVDRVDAPIVILDLSLPETHAMEEDFGSTALGNTELNFLTYDPGRPSDFPLHLSDDSEALYAVCRATGGCFLDFDLLTECSRNLAGQQQIGETIAPYHYSYKRRFVKMNGVQWLALFSLSPLSPTLHSSWDKLAPPQYLQKRLNLGMIEAPNTELGYSRHESSMRQPSEPRRGSLVEGAALPKSRQHYPSRTTFSTYVISPIRIKALLLMRIKEGYRARQYRVYSQETVKVFIQFTLPLEFGTVLHYELSYKASSRQNHMVGSAHIKIELSGDPGFVQSVKTDFLRQGQESRPFTMAQKVSSRLCQVLRWIRREDILQSYLSPPSRWSDQLGSPGAPFAKRLGSMSSLQRRRHFQLDEFDVVCTGRLPGATDDGLLSEFLSVDNGEQGLRDLIKDWSTQVLDSADSKFVRTMSPAGGTTSYLLVEIQQCAVAPRLFTVGVEFYGGTDPTERLYLLAALKTDIAKLRDVKVLNKQLGPFLLGTSHQSVFKKRNVEFSCHHARWDLVKDPELLPLVMKRRTEIGRFHLLHTDDNSANFAKVVPESIVGEPGDLVQYQVAILPDKVVVDLHMESECGVFFPQRFGSEGAKRFNGMVKVLRRRDQECGRALRSRTHLLRVFQQPMDGDAEDSDHSDQDHKTSVRRMLQYASPMIRRLRFFTSAGRANEILSEITEDLLLSGRTGISAAKLSITPEELLEEEEAGLWFVVQFDRHTMSIVHLSLIDKSDDEDNNPRTYRNLSFFTVGISDLYSRRDDMVDDDSEHSHISEHLCVTELAEQFEVAEKQNLAAAAYLALRHNSTEICTIRHDDFAEVQDALEYTEVASVLLAGSGISRDEVHVEAESKRLTRVIQTILSLVPGDDHCLYYSGPEVLDRAFGLNGNESDSSGLDDSIDTAIEDGDSTEMTNMRLTHPDEDPTAAADTTFAPGPDSVTTASPPVFVKFKLDGAPVSFGDLNNVRKSATLSAEISVFRREGRSRLAAGQAGENSLPWSHQAVATELSMLLKSYVAEQTIERLRHNSSPSDDDLRLVNKCMKRVQSVMSFSIEVYFYISKTDCMVPSSAPAGGESEVEEGFKFLDEELRGNTDYSFQPVSSGGFLVSSKLDDTDALEFWCFLNVDKNEGLVTSQIYHPNGEGRALDVMSNVHTVAAGCIHRVNQQLLLKSLHLNRTASALLIPKLVNSPDEAEQSSAAPTEQEQVAAANFRCPVVFRTLFDLFHRCATNPTQVARQLEATVLHSFAVSNRSGVFVYKDEAGAIFYMCLRAKGSGIDADGQVELLVHGIHEPGPSVTEQLKSILKRRLLLIAVDLLSAVLTKNPHFNVKYLDMKFLRSFGDEWRSLEKEKQEVAEQDFYYEIPEEVYDPCMMLLMFRQNLCGSTFFHRLNDIGYDQASPPITENRPHPSGGVVLNWNDHAFTLYYNNAASKLDPTFQAISTLTEKGSMLNRLIGTGIAIIEVALVQANGMPADEIPFVVPEAVGDNDEDPEAPKLRLRKLDKFPLESSNLCIRVRVTDTALSRVHVHEGVCLSLSQSLVAWQMEREMERSTKRFQGQVCTKPTHTLPPGAARRHALHNIAPGLPAMMDILDSTHDLPHPAVSKVENHGVIRSSSIASITLDLLESCILPSALPEAKSSERLNKARPNLCIVRMTKSGSPEKVHLAWNSSLRKSASVWLERNAGDQEPISDSPIDSPEYICFYTLTNFGERGDEIDPHIQLYREVMIHDDISDRSPSIELLEQLKVRFSNSFHRSFAFVFTVQRNRRVLWTYNWNPTLVQSTSARLQESELSVLQEVGRQAHSLQYRSLRVLSPPTGVKESKLDKPRRSIQSDQESAQAPPENASIQKAENVTPAARKPRRPMTIRRPKLIGKSVEGAALQAVAASRKRASTNQFKNVGSSSSARRAPSQTNTREGSRGKTAQASVDGSSKGPKRLPPSSRHRREREFRDEAAVRVKSDYTLLSTMRFWQLRRQAMLNAVSTRVLADLWWPRQPQRNIPRSIAEYIISKSAMTWCDSCEVLPTPEGILEVFIPAFAGWLSTFTPGLDLLPVAPSGSPARSNSVLLSSAIKNVRGCKCLAVVKLSKVRKNNSWTIRCEGWVASLSRRPRKSQLQKLDGNTTTLQHREKDSAGMDKLTTDVHRSLVLESLLFDFSSSLVERAVRLLEERIDLRELIPTVRGLISQYPLERQKRMPLLNYRAFEATIVLKSYRDKMIDKFDSATLYQRLHREPEMNEMFRCGEGVCFKRGISVKGRHSVCFLAFDPSKPAQMSLVILCRTQGRNLSDFMFREGSNTAVHVLDAIVYDAAGLAYEALKSVAVDLTKDALWDSLTSMRPKRNRTERDVNELLELCFVRPILQSMGTPMRDTELHALGTLLSQDSGINWTSCCEKLRNDLTYKPNWFHQREQIRTHFFYMKTEDVFLRLVVDKQGSLKGGNIIEKGESITAERRQSAIKRFAGFLVDFIWNRL